MPSFDTLFEHNIDAEFEHLQEETALYNPDFQSATQQCNLYKNRYSNVFPNETTRVKLAETPFNGDGSDYINANYVNGEVPGSSKAYILCQAPLLHTIDDFWRMIWECSTPVIVMLTRLWERNRQQAEVYWPAEGQRECYGFVCVLNQKTVVVDNITVRYLTLQMKTGKTVISRDIVQLHYQDWPDFGAPTETQQILALLKLMDSFKQSGQLDGLTGPIVTHCSAGLGRTGTLIAIHISLENWRHNQPVCVFETVRSLRQQRAKTIQSAAQYKFVYKVICDAVKEKSGEISVDVEDDEWTFINPPFQFSEVDVDFLASTSQPRSQWKNSSIEVQ